MQEEKKKRKENAALDTQNDIVQNCSQISVKNSLKYVLDGHVSM